MNKNQILAGVAVILALVLVFVLLGQKLGLTRQNKDYSVVYVSTGEVYIGKLTTFPNLELKDSYLLQVAKDSADPSKNTFQIQPLSEALWAPKTLYLVEDNVIFYGPLTPDSKIAQTLAAQKK